MGKHKCGAKSSLGATNLLVQRRKAGHEKGSIGCYQKGGHHDSSTTAYRGGTRQTTAAVGKKAFVEEIKKEQKLIIVSDEHAMVVNLPPRMVFSHLRKSRLLRKSHIATGTARRSETYCRVSSRAHTSHKDEDDLEDDQSANKKRHTPSVPPEEDLQASKRLALEQGKTNTMRVLLMKWPLSRRRMNPISRRRSRSLRLIAMNEWRSDSYVFFVSI